MAIALSVLEFIGSEKILQLAYEAYRSAEPEHVGTAMLLIAKIAHPRSLDWMEEFLRDPATARVGIKVLDQLLFKGAVDPDDERVASTLALGLAHELKDVRSQARRIRADLRRRQAGRRVLDLPARTG